jgi:hypothetical protein
MSRPYFTESEKEHLRHYLRACTSNVTGAEWSLNDEEATVKMFIRDTSYDPDRGPHTRALIKKVKAEYFDESERGEHIAYALWRRLRDVPLLGSLSLHPNSENIKQRVKAPPPPGHLLTPHPQSATLRRRINVGIERKPPSADSGMLPVIVSPGEPFSE